MPLLSPASVITAKRRILFWLENPDRSWIWQQPSFFPLLEVQGLGFWGYDCCRFNQPCRKSTGVLTNSDLVGVETLCQGGHQHLVLCGRPKRHRQNVFSCPPLLALLLRSYGDELYRSGFPLSSVGAHAASAVLESAAKISTADNAAVVVVVFKFPRPTCQENSPWQSFASAARAGGCIGTSNCIETMARQLLGVDNSRGSSQRQGGLSVAEPCKAQTCLHERSRFMM